MMTANHEEDEMDAKAIEQALAAPFAPGEVKWKPQAVKDNRALAVPYVDARVIMDRLDDVLGVLGWQDSYDCLSDGNVVCHLKIHDGAEWIEKVDVGGQSEQPDEGDRRKAAFSDAIKRAAVKFGLGRYLYRLGLQWLDYDPKSKKFTQTPKLPAWAIPQTDAQKAPEPKVAPAPVKAAQQERPIGERLLNRLRAKEDQLVAAGLTTAGELIKDIRDAGTRTGFDDKMDKWTEEQVNTAVGWVKAFEQNAVEAFATRATKAQETPAPEPAANGPLISTQQISKLATLLTRKGKKFSSVARLVQASEDSKIEALTYEQGKRLYNLAMTWVDASELKI